VLVACERKNQRCIHTFLITYFCCAHCYLVSQVTNHAPRSPMIKPVNGLDIANQSGIAWRNGCTSRLRIRELAFVAGKSATRDLSRELIGFIPSSLPSRAPREYWTFVLPPAPDGRNDRSDRCRCLICDLARVEPQSPLRKVFQPVHMTL
jgi:hypothetical protein